MSIPQGGQLDPHSSAADNNYGFKDAVKEYMMTGDIKPPQDDKQGKIQLTDGQSRNVESLKGKPLDQKISDLSSKL